MTKTSWSVFDLAILGMTKEESMAILAKKAANRVCVLYCMCPASF
jgi:hypothetical protein